MIIALSTASTQSCLLADCIFTDGLQSTNTHRGRRSAAHCRSLHLSLSHPKVFINYRL